MQLNRVINGCFECPLCKELVRPSELVVFRIDRKTACVCRKCKLEKINNLIIEENKNEI